MLLGLPDIVQGGMESRERAGRQERERGRGRGERRKKALCGGPDLESGTLSQESI